ncbi:putative 2-succinyl-6-hydroxy-2,4-cyclohexadiene-1-carboxylate synthase [Streptomyces fumigatiscleroticus]|nr:putative 2-succinyl-6-hydroxy-2,4-cyclohexadiene-1-carboxylate synthase [Streptomyces fumigatiscleroticus]
MQTHTPRLLTTPDGTRIAYRDHAPRAPTPTGSSPFLLLHGLAGHQGEWTDLASRLPADGHRVVTYDARGHGESTRRPAATTRDSHVRDAVTLIETLALAPVTLVGQSLGGHTAMLLTSARPDLVKSLILVEAGPGGPNPDLPTHIAAWLDSWPAPFPSLDAARRFLGHQAWAEGLEKREDGRHPRFDRDVMIETISPLATTAYWEEWSRITRPTLLVTGENGTMRDGEPAEMLARRPDLRHTLIAEAGHDVHLDQPGKLYAAVTAFLKTDNRAL